MRQDIKFPIACTGIFSLLAIVYLKVKGLIKVSANLSKLCIAAIATTFKAKSTALETCRQLFSSQTEITT